MMKQKNWILQQKKKLKSGYQCMSKHTSRMNNDENLMDKITET